MKIHTLLLLFLALASTILLATACHAQYRSDSCGCPIPLGDTGGTFDGRYFPPYVDLAENLSSDGKWLALRGAGLINLQTLGKKYIVINGGYPNAQQAGSGGIVWCPYDPDMIALFVSYYIDTTGTGASGVRVENIFTYRISTGEATRITPTILGKYGPPGMGSVLAWLPTSTHGKDSFMIVYSEVDARDHHAFFGIYSPQTQALIPESMDYTDTVAWSSDLKHRVWATRDTILGSLNYGGPSNYYMDSTLLNFPIMLDTTQAGIHGVSFSPDGKLVAYWVFPLGWGPPADTIFDQVWVCNVSNPAIPECVINFQCLYCKYSFWGIYPVFLTDSTLAVSMHHDGDSISPLWEITMCGQIVRQLTYLPQSGVVGEALSKNILSLNSFPDPCTSLSKISFSLTEAGLVALVLTDATGRETALLQSAWLAAGQHEVILDASKFPSGVYLCRLSLGENVVMRKMIVEH